ncbi:hypothetical protein AR456_07885 [Halomonas huangheensis]|nr:hypothetical protein AR456_07885 [Halomonas huangheensis]
MVVGPGAIGRLLALSLQRTVQDSAAVSLLGRRTLPEQQCLETPDGKRIPLRITTLMEPSHAPIRPDMVVHLTTKSWATMNAFETLAPHLPVDIPLVLWQNGFRVQHPISNRWMGPVLCASTTEGAYVVDDSHVVHAGRGHTVIGHLNGHYREVAVQLAEQLSHAGLAATAVDDIEVRLWHKLVVNAVINPLVARFRITNGQLRDTPYSSLVEATLDELSTLMQALKVPAPPSTSLYPWHDLVWQVIERTAANRASMLQDLEANRPTEYDAILGPLREAAQTAGIATPQLDSRWQELEVRNNQG